MPLPPSVDKLQRSLAREAVYATLQEWIVRGTLQPGETLRDQDLAVALGVSRTPVREALRRLEDEGLVLTALNRWTRVAPVDVRAADELYPIVGCLEGLAIRQAPGRFNKAQLRALAKANRQLQQAVTKGDAVAAVDADTLFHQHLLEPADNRELQQIIHGIKVKLRRLELAYFGTNLIAEQSIKEHAAIIERLKLGDHAAAAQAVEANWNASLKRFKEHVSNG